jgi:hypothetical protein
MQFFLQILIQDEKLLHYKDDNKICMTLSKNPDITLEQYGDGEAVVIQYTKPYDMESTITFKLINNKLHYSAEEFNLLCGYDLKLDALCYDCRRDVEFNNYKLVREGETESDSESDQESCNGECDADTKDDSCPKHSRMLFTVCGTASLDSWDGKKIEGTIEDDNKLAMYYENKSYVYITLNEIFGALDYKNLLKDYMVSVLNSKYPTKINKNIIEYVG